MIGHIKGVVAMQQPPLLVLDVQGVGYEINAPLPVFFQLPPAPEPLHLFTHLVVREDVQQLYGFSTLEDRNWFRELIKISGVGPRMGLAILSAMSAKNLCETIMHQQTTVLQKVPGVGKKTAERLVIELAEKCKKWLARQNHASEEGVGHVASFDTASNQSVQGIQAEQDAHAALMALGYKSAEASKVLQRVFSPDQTSEQLIKHALREMVQV